MLTIEQQNKISNYLATHHIPSGLGTEEEACSIAAINIALSGKLTDKIPDCMSQVIGRWIIIVQDAMPDEMRNSSAWKQLLPLAAGTGRDKVLEAKRAELILKWMWEVVLPSLQDIATKNGFGVEWKKMCADKTPEAAAWAASRVAARVAAWAAWEQFNPVGLLQQLVDVK